MRKVFLTAPSIGSAKAKSADKLLREAAEMQGLSDISTSPSRPGGSVAERLRMKTRDGMAGPNGRQYPEYAAARSMDFRKDFGAVTHKANELATVGLGNTYNKDEWKKDEKTGKLRHIAPAPPKSLRPTGSTGVSVERVKE